MKPLLQIPCVIDSLRTLKDGSIKITIETQEITPEDFTILAQYRNTFGYMVFRETPVTEADLANVPDVVPEFKNDKTPSQRLRAVFYRMWEQSGKPGENFQTWYVGKMEQLIDHYKQQLD